MKRDGRPSRANSSWAVTLKPNFCMTLDTGPFVRISSRLKRDLRSLRENEDDLEAAASAGGEDEPLVGIEAAASPVLVDVMYLVYD